MPAASSTLADESVETNDILSIQTSESLTRHARAEFDSLLEFTIRSASKDEFRPFEDELVRRVFAFGCLLTGLFLQLSSERLEVPNRSKRGRCEFRRQGSKRRVLKMFFGLVPYWRVYVHRTNGRGGGYFPLDVALELTATVSRLEYWGGR